MTDDAVAGALAPARRQREQALLETELYEQIGRLKMELEWLKKTTVAKSAREQFLESRQI